MTAAASAAMYGSLQQVSLAEKAFSNAAGTCTAPQRRHGLGASVPIVQKSCRLTGNLEAGPADAAAAVEIGVSSAQACVQADRRPMLARARTVAAAASDFVQAQPEQATATAAALLAAAALPGALPGLVLVALLAAAVCPRRGHSGKDMPAAAPGGRAAGAGVPASWVLAEKARPLSGNCSTAAPSPQRSAASPSSSRNSRMQRWRRTLASAVPLQVKSPQLSACWAGLRACLPPIQAMLRS